MTVKDLRSMIKGIPGSAIIDYGNSSGYSPEPDASNLQINLEDGHIFFKDQMADKKSINIITFWSPE